MLEYQYKPLAKDIAYRILRVSLQKSKDNEYMFTKEEKIDEWKNEKKRFRWSFRI